MLSTFVMAAGKGCFVRVCGVCIPKENRKGKIAKKKFSKFSSSAFFYFYFLFLSNGRAFLLL